MSTVRVSDMEYLEVLTEGIERVLMVRNLLGPRAHQSSGPSSVAPSAIVQLQPSDAFVNLILEVL
jgi:hypothetical protein